MMKKLSKRTTLPSCTVDKQLITRLENFLFSHVTRLLKKDLSQQMGLYDLKDPASLRTYSLTITDKNNTVQFDTIKNFKPQQFEPKTSKVVMQLKLGRPEIIDISIMFPGNGMPSTRISTVSQNVKPICSKITAQLISLFDSARNKNYIVSQTWFRVLLLLTPSALITGLGIWLGGHIYYLVAAQGWILIMSAILAFNLFRLFPMVGFRTRRTFNLNKLFALLFFGLTTTVIAVYTYLLYLNLGLVSLPG
jgi:hypothetical protein